MEVVANAIRQNLLYLKKNVRGEVLFRINKFVGINSVHLQVDFGISFANCASKMFELKCSNFSFFFCFLYSKVTSIYSAFFFNLKRGWLLFLVPNVYTISPQNFEFQNEWKLS